MSMGPVMEAPPTNMGFQTQLVDDAEGKAYNFLTGGGKADSNASAGSLGRYAAGAAAAGGGEGGGGGGGGMREDRADRGTYGAPPAIGSPPVAFTTLPIAPGMMGTRVGAVASPPRPPVVIGGDADDDFARRHIPEGRGSNGAEQLLPIDPPKELLEEVPHSPAEEPEAGLPRRSGRQGEFEAQSMQDGMGKCAHSMMQGGSAEQMIERPDTPVDDLAMRLLALQREVSEGAKRVQRMGNEDSPPKSSASGAGPARQPTIRWGEDEVRPITVESWPDSEESFEGRGQDASLDAGGYGGYAKEMSSEESAEEHPSDDERDGEEQAPRMQMEDLVSMRRKLQAQAAENDGVALGTGNLFNRPSPADLLRGVKSPANIPAPKQASAGTKAAGGARGRSPGTGEGVQQQHKQQASAAAIRSTGPVQHEVCVCVCVCV